MDTTPRTSPDTRVTATAQTHAETPDPLTDDERHVLAEYAARHDTLCQSRDCFTAAELKRLGFWRWRRERDEVASGAEHAETILIDAPPD